jgi:hypothetical protein
MAVRTTSPLLPVQAVLNRDMRAYVSRLDSQSPLYRVFTEALGEELVSRFRLETARPSSQPNRLWKSREAGGADQLRTDGSLENPSPTKKRPGLRLSEDFPASESDHPEDRSPERSLVMQDLRSFTRELEIDSLGIEKTYRNESYLQRFERGDIVAPASLENEKYYLFQFKSGGETHFGTSVNKEVYDLYRLWKRHRGFPDPGQAGHSDPEVQRLERFLRQHHVSLWIGDYVSPQQIRYIHSFFEMLPAPLFDTKFLRFLQLGGERKDASKFDCYDPIKKEVALFQGLVRGPRRMLLGFLLHGLGHAIAEQLLLESGEEMQKCFDTLRDGRTTRLVHTQGNVVYPLDWDLAESRRMYLDSHVSEFIAEHVLIYRVAGPGLRKHIAAIPNSEQRDSYEWFYGNLRERVFEGEEFAL